MAESSAHLLDEVFSHKVLRQWVLRFPFPLRFLFAKKPKLIGCSPQFALSSLQPIFKADRYSEM